MRTNQILTAALLPTTLLIAACSGEGQDNAAANDAVAAAPTSASLKTADGRDVGSAALSEDGTGVTIKVEVTGLAAGQHGLHLHTVGRCDPPKFETAGPHWNPTGKKHGRDNPDGAHLGDMANLDVDAAGRGAASFLISGSTLSGNENPLLDLDGAALVVHAKPDDYKTDPSGDSGDRIACAILGG